MIEPVSCCTGLRERIRIPQHFTLAEYGFFLFGYVEENGMKRGSSLGNSSSSRVTRRKKAENTIKSMALIHFFLFRAVLCRA